MKSDTAREGVFFDLEVGIMSPDKLPTATTASSSRQRHRVNHENIEIIIEKIDNFDHPSALAASDDLKLVVSNLPRETTSGILDNGFNFRNRTSMLCSMLDVPLDPSEPHSILYKIRL